MKDFSIQVSQVAHDKDEDGLDDTDVVGKASNETRKEAPNDADKCTTERNHNEGGETGQNICIFDIFLAHTHVGVEHVV